jgi:DNA-binding transcriptional LysR family regulator
MDIRQLTYLIALAREKHFTKAAEACLITQPTLSSRIRQLEDELGVPIVERGQRYIGLTREGETVLKWAHAILDNCASLTQELAAMGEGLSGRLTLGVIPTALLATPRITELMRRLHPKLDFTILSMSSVEILSALKDYAIDAGITYLDNEPITALKSQGLYRETYRLVVRTGHPMAAMNTVRWAEAGSLPLCLLNPEMQNRRIIDGVFTRLGITPVCHVETTSISNVLAHVRTAGLAGIVPSDYLAGLGILADIASIELVEPDVSHAIGLVTLDREPPSPTIAALFAACSAAV